MADTAAKVLAILDPPPHRNKDGHMVSEDAYYNLEGALHDLRRQKADPICIRTIERVQKQIAKVLDVCAPKTKKKAP